MIKYPPVIKNIIYIIAGVAGAIFGCTLFDDGFIYAGGGIVLVFCGIYIAWHGLKSIINGNKPDDDEDSNQNNPKPYPVHPGKKKKKKKKTKKY